MISCSVIMEKKNYSWEIAVIFSTSRWHTKFAFFHFFIYISLTWYRNLYKFICYLYHASGRCFINTKGGEMIWMQKNYWRSFMKLLQNKSHRRRNSPKFLRWNLLRFHIGMQQSGLLIKDTQIGKRSWNLNGLTLACR